MLMRAVPSSMDLSDGTFLPSFLPRRVPPPCDTEMDTSGRNTYLLEQLAAVFTVPSFLSLCANPSKLTKFGSEKA